MLPIFSQIIHHMEICRQEKIGIILENQRLAARETQGKNKFSVNLQNLKGSNIQPNN